MENGQENLINNVLSSCSPLPKLKIINECDEENIGENKMDDSNRRQIYESINLNTNRDRSRNVNLINELYNVQNSERNEDSKNEE